MGESGNSLLVQKKERGKEGDISKEDDNNKEHARVSYEVMQILWVPSSQLSRASESNQRLSGTSTSIQLVVKPEPEEEEEKEAAAAAGADDSLHTQKWEVANVSPPASCYTEGDEESVASCDEDPSYAAMRLHSSLSPSMVKGMIKPRVSGSFWLVRCAFIPLLFFLCFINCCGPSDQHKRMDSDDWILQLRDLNSSFCAQHLPHEDTVITLEDEAGNCYQINYVACRAELSSGWKEFATSHNLSSGDVLVFHLTNPTKFKIHIFRANHREEMEGVCTRDTILEKLNFANEATDDTDSGSTGSSNNIERPELDPPWISFRESKLYLSKGGSFDHELHTCLMGPFGPIRDFTSFKDQLLRDRARGRPPLRPEPNDSVLEDYYKFCLSEGHFLHRGLYTKRLHLSVDAFIYEIVYQCRRLKGLLQLEDCDFTKLEGIKVVLKEYEDIGYAAGFMIKFIDRLLRYKEEPLWLEANLKEDIACFNKYYYLEENV